MGGVVGWESPVQAPFWPRSRPVLAPFTPRSGPVLLEQAPVERPVYGKVFLTRTVHVHCTCNFCDKEI